MPIFFSPKLKTPSFVHPFSYNIYDRKFNYFLNLLKTLITIFANNRKEKAK